MTPLVCDPGTEMHLKYFLALLLAIAAYSSQAEEQNDNEWLTDQWDNLFAVAGHGLGEPQSIGSYAVRIYRNNRDAYVIGQIGSRNGSIAGLWLDDLDDDDKPEVIVWISNAGSGGYGELHVYTLEKASLPQIILPEPNFKLISGYRGHDAFSLEDGHMYRSFPRYRTNDSMAEPTGGTIRLKLDFNQRLWQEVNSK